MKGFEVGQEIETTVVQISNDTVFIDLGLKSEGFVDKSEFVDENGNISINEGDKIKVYFVSANRDELRFTTKLSADKAAKIGLEILDKAHKAGLPVEGHVEKEIKGGFEIKLGSSRAFCPYSQMGYKNRAEPAEYVGKTLTFLIIEYKNDGKDILVSNRKVLENEENENFLAVTEKIKVGETVTATVKTLQSYGAFVDINGFQALLPISEISHTRIKDVSEVLAVGQKINVKIIRAEWNGPNRSKVSVSIKELEQDPWSSVSSVLKIGDKIEGAIARIAAFGLFVNLKPGIDGLVHISALQNVNDKTNLSKKFKVGEKFDVVIEKIDEEEKRISLVPATSDEQDTSANEYFSSHADDSDGETYNPFAALLKK